MVLIDAQNDLNVLLDLIFALIEVMGDLIGHFFHDVLVVMGVLNDRDPALFLDELRVQKELQLRLVLELRRLVHDFDEIGVNF